MQMTESESNPIRLRRVDGADLSIFFEQQLDLEANQMAAFTAKDPTDRAAFDERWTKILADENLKIRTIVLEDAVAGHILVHRWFGKPEISYWLGKQYWGQGLASQALVDFLDLVEERPLFARAAHDNAGSIRVLQKNGFAQVGEEIGFSNARGVDVRELMFELGTDPRSPNTRLDHT